MKALEHKAIPKEVVELINKTPFLMSLCYDRDVLPEQFLALKKNKAYPLKYAELMGIIVCYQAMQSQNADRGAQ